MNNGSDFLSIFDLLSKNAELIVKVATETQETSFIGREMTSLLDYFGTFRISLLTFVQQVGNIDEQPGIFLPIDVRYRHQIHLQGP